MTFLAPGFLFASMAVAAAIAALHFIVTRQPRAAILPTARFVPDTPATTIAPVRRPSDLLVMILRMLVVLAAGAALAKPILTASRGASARVILVDVSRSVSDSIAIRDSARSVYRDGDAVVLFDSSTRLLSGGIAEALASLQPQSGRGNVSAALIGALRAGSALRDRADSLDLVIISPFAREELDAATDSIRRLWPGRARLIRIAAPPPPAPSVAAPLDISADPTDPLRETVRLVRTTNGASALIDRRPPSSLSRATEASIEWPASGRPRFAIQRPVRDTVGGVAAGDSRVVARFVREWSYPDDSLRGTEVVARWVDGEPAAVERRDGEGCTRSVAIPVSSAGDLVLRPEFVQLVATLAAPCTWKSAVIPADPAAVGRLEGSGGLAPRDAFMPPTEARSELAPWLFALALAAAIAELLARRWPA